MHVLGLDHLQIAMPAGGEAAARAFYGALLGLTEIAKPAGLARRGGCWFQGAGFQVHLGVDPDFYPARKAHPALRVADLAAAQADLAAAGFPVTPDEAVPHVRRFYTSDPFGNRIEIIQEGDTF